MAQEPSINVSLHAQTDIGMVRHGNEDNFLVVDLSTAETWTVENSSSPPKRLVSFSQGHYGALVAVSDGMGGALAGEVASQMAVSAVRDRMLQFQATPSFSQFAFHERLRLAIEQANLLINVESQNNVEYTGMGATFTAAGLDHDVAYMAQVGDSRCYLIRQGKIAQVTKDQSLVSQLVEAGHITEEEAEAHTYKNVILQALGAQPRVNVIVDRVRLRKKDTILLCSDGLSGKVKGPEMLKIYQENTDIKSVCDALIKLANERGGEDNITVLVATFDGEGLQEPTAEDPFKGEFLPRDPALPDEIDPSQLVVVDDETLRPEEQPVMVKSEKQEKERVDVVETQEVQATMLNIPAVTPQMLAAHAQLSQVGDSSEPIATTPSPINSSISSSVSTPSSPMPAVPPPTPVMEAPAPQPRTMAASASVSHSADDTDETNNKGSGRTILLIIMVVLLLGLAFLGWNYYKTHNQSSNTPPDGVSSTQASLAPVAPNPADKQRNAELLDTVARKVDTLRHDALTLPKSPQQESISSNLKSVNDGLETLKRNNENGMVNTEDLNKQSQAMMNSLTAIEQQLGELSKASAPTTNKPATGKPATNSKGEKPGSEKPVK